MNFKNNFTYFLFPLFLFVLALVRFLFFLPQVPDSFTHALNKKVVFTGEIKRDPLQKGERFLLDIQPNNTDILIRTFVGNKNISYGDIVSISGTLKNPEPFETSSSKLFDYQNYLFSKGVYFVLENPKIISVEHDDSFSVFRFLFNVKNNCIQRLQSFLSQETFGLGVGMVLGGSQQLSKELNQYFIYTGTIHIVALSGFNIAIILTTVRTFLIRYFSLLTSSIISVSFAFLFVAMTGFQSTALRAFVMILFSFSGIMFGRPVSTMRSIVIAGLILLVYDPRMIYDVSFQLSFIATFGIVVLPKYINNYIGFITNTFSLRENISTTIGATLFTIPFVAYKMGTVSIVSILVNIIIAPLIPLSMFGVFLTLLVSLVHPFIASIVGAITSVPIYLIIKTVSFFGKLSFAYFTVSAVPLFIPIMFYLSFVIFIIISKLKESDSSPDSFVEKTIV